MIHDLFHNSIPGAPIEVLLFLLLATAAVLGAISVVVSRDPFVSALSLIVNFASLGTLYLMLNAVFVAVAQVIVYAGAVVVLFLFVMAYLGDRREISASSRMGPMGSMLIIPMAIGVALALSTLIGLVLFGAVGGGLTKTPATVPAEFGSVALIGQSFLTKYVLAFEVTSLVLLVAAIGGVVLGLTGRARHTRMRTLSGMRSADQLRKQHGQSLGDSRGNLDPEKHPKSASPTGKAIVGTGTSTNGSSNGGAV